MAKNFVPLPYLDLEEHGIEFTDLAFPVGFDEERLSVNIDAVRRTTRMAGLGLVAVHGASGPKSDFTPSVSGIDSQGTASLGVGLMQQKEKEVNGVRVLSRREQEVWAAYSTLNLPESFRYAPTIIRANVSERDERLRTNTKLKRGLMDPNGHSKFLNTVVSDGLLEATKQRREQIPGERFNRFNFFFGVGAVALNTINGPTAVARQAGIFIGIWGAGDVIVNQILAKKSGNNLTDAQISLLLGYDRYYASKFLAKTQRFVSAQK